MRNLHLVLFVSLLVTNAFAQMPLCSDPTVSANFYGLGTQVEKARTAFMVPSAFQTTDIESRLFGQPGWWERANLWNLGRRQERYESVLMDLTLLSNYDPAKMRAIQQRFLQQAPEIVKKSILYTLLDDYLTKSVNINQKVSDIEKGYQPVEDVKTVIEGLKKIAELTIPSSDPSQLPMELKKFFPQEYWTLVVNPSQWNAARQWLNTFSTGAQIASIVGSSLKLGSAEVNIISTVLFNQILVNEGARERIKEIDLALSSDPSLSRDPALVTAIGNIKIFLDEGSSQQMLETLFQSIKDNEDGLISGSTSLALTLCTPQVLNEIETLAMGAGATTANAAVISGSWCLGLFFLEQEFLIVLGITEQLEDSELAVCYSTIASSLCSQAFSSKSLRIPAMYGYVESASHVIKMAEKTPIPIFSSILYRTNTEVATQWRSILEGYTAKLNNEFAINTYGGPSSLTSPTISSISGTTNDKFVFSVRYISNPPQAPDYIRLAVDKSYFTLAAQSGDWASGPTYTYTASFSAGQHFFHFEGSVNGAPLSPTAETSFEVVPPGSSNLGMIMTLNSNQIQVGESTTAKATLSPVRAGIGINFSSSNSNIVEQLTPNPVNTDASGVAMATFRARALGTVDVKATESGNSSNTAAKGLDVVSYVAVTVQTSPSGRIFKVDGESFSGAKNFSWQIGSHHSIYAVDVQEQTAGIRYEWASWSNGGGISQIVSPTTATVYTANFTTQYFLTTSAGPGGEISPSSGWFVAGTRVPVVATNMNFYRFSAWSGDLVGSSNPTTMLMDGPKSISAQFISDYRTLVINSANPDAGLTVSVSPADKNGISSGSTPLTLTYDAGLVISLTAPASAGAVPFQGWKLGASAYSTTTTMQIAMSQDWQLTATYSSAPMSDWATVPSATVASLNSVKALSSTAFVAVGVDYNPTNGYYDRSLVIKSTNGGSAWVNIPISNIASLNKLAFPSSSVGYIIGGSAKILKSGDGGNSWTQIADLSEAGYPDRIHFVSPEIGFAFGTSGFNKTTNGGSSWTKGYFNLSSGLLALYFTSPTTGFGFGYNGIVAKTLDGGTTWIQKPSPTTARLNSAYFPSSSIGYAVGGAGTIIKTTDGGETWLSQVSPTSTQLTEVAFVNDNVGFVSGYSDILKTTDGGQSWAKQAKLTTNVMYSVAAVSSTSCIMVGEGGTVLKHSGSLLAITTPNGGETVAAGQSLNISWTATNVSSILLEYTSDNGSTWNTIQNGVNGTTGKYPWTVPDISSTQCKIRAINGDNANVYAESDRVFTIQGTSFINIISPVGGEIWWGSEIDTISWRSKNIANVRIDYTTNDGLTWSGVAASVAATTNRYVWRVPNTLSSSCRIRISDVTNANMKDSSQNRFSISLKMPELPKLWLPLNNAVVTVPSNKLVWKKALNATRYWLQVSSIPDFSSSLVNDSTLVDTAFVLTNVPYSTTIYWRVKAIGDFGSTSFADPWTFTTFFAPPLIPLLSIPDKGAILSAGAIRLSWQRALRAEQYHLQISLDSTFSSSIALNDSTIIDTSANFASAAQTKMYYWRVRSLSSSRSSEWTSVWSFGTKGVISLASLRPPKRIVISPRDSAYVYGTILGAGITDIPGPSSNVQAWLGYTRDSMDTNPTKWTNWMQAHFSNQVGNQDDYVAKVANLPIGEYQFVFRFNYVDTLLYAGTDSTFYNESKRNSGRLFVLDKIFRLSTKALQYNNTLLNGHRDTAIVVSNPGNDTLRVSDVFVSPNFSSSLRNRFVLPPGGYLVDTIRFAPTKQGTTLGSIVFTSNAITSPDTLSISGVGVITSVEQGNIAIPTAFALSQNYPNPFNPSTTIRFALPKTCPVTLKVFDLLGREVTTLLSQDLGAGHFAVKWQANVPSGIYFYRLQAGEYVETKKLIILK